MNGVWGLGTKFALAHVGQKRIGLFTLMAFVRGIRLPPAAPLARAILHIVLLRAYKQVVRPEACRIVALMAHKKALWDGPVGQFPGFAVYETVTHRPIPTPRPRPRPLPALGLDGVNQNL